jgi:signal transduction histidine kinase
MAPVAIAEVVDEVLAEARFQADAREVTLDAEVAAVLPTVTGNRPLLNTMLRNLVGNAIKFSQPGGTVEITAEYADNALLLKVTDHGIGISETDLPHLFEKFYRSLTAQEAGIRGTGIGLVLVKQAVDAHHGSITVESHVGSGACFTVTLPANGATPEAAAHIIELLPVPEFAL